MKNGAYYDSNGATALSADTLDTILAGAADTPKKFGFQSTGDTDWTALKFRLTAVGASDGASQMRIALDTASTTPTLSPPWGVTVTVGAPGSGIWAATGVYAIAVTAVNARGETVISRENVFTINDTTREITVDWEAVSGADTYNLYLRSYPSGTYDTPSYIGSTSGVSFGYDGTTPGAGEPPDANTTGGAAPGYGTPPASFGLGPASVGALAFGAWVFFWVKRVVQVSASSGDRFGDIVATET